MRSARSAPARFDELRAGLFMTWPGSKKKKIMKKKKPIYYPMNLPLKFVAIAFNDYGGIGFEFYSAVVRPYFEGLREKEEEAGGSGRDARKQKSEFLQRVSITIAKGNSGPSPRLYAPRLAIFHRTRLGH
jgi:hypothetical protein